MAAAQQRETNTYNTKGRTVCTPSSIFPSLGRSTSWVIPARTPLLAKLYSSAPGSSGYPPPNTSSWSSANTELLSSDLSIACLCTIKANNPLGQYEWTTGGKNCGGTAKAESKGVTEKAWLCVWDQNNVPAQLVQVFYLLI